MRAVIVLGLGLALAGCSAGSLPWQKPAAPVAAPAPSAAPADALRAAPPPPAGARTAAALDTTTPAQRAAAVASAPAAGEHRLGTTIASLGAPAKPGFWLRSPLASKPGRGRVTAQGHSVAVDLIPAPGPKGAGSQMSLAAFRALGLPLTALPEVTVYGP